ncbi:malonate transporter MadL subunit [Neolewinella xylanilytica]|uniref:Malonate transporter MadL subunit n=1 Tax=Neolewinella xylanilytica TaxID=1514080 RepID=A0A2S6I8A3_9BACT|nr:malonate transporter subunit MadL [Neolewinella xylanilytica]PPK87712.1 malonate transporter MadL subunit [Neolewinella xylanilytica]
MTIYGVATLAACFLLGKVVGTLLGAVIGIDGDVGGVGFAMLLLILVNGYLRRRGMMDGATAGGIRFWSAMYIPIIVAMASVQHATAALSGGWLALLAGIVATLAALALVPLLSRIGRPGEETAKES